MQTDISLIDTYFPEAIFFNSEYKEWCDEKLKKAPSYFWTVPASPSEKFHKTDGKTVSLLDHVRKVLIAGNELYHVFGLTEDERDICTSAIILHDMFKCGLPDEVVYRTDNGNPRTSIMHPNLVRIGLKDIKKEKGFFFLSSVRENAIFSIIEGHMGIWSPVSSCYPFRQNAEKFNQQVSLSRFEQMIVFVHFCDMVGSRNTISVELKK